MKISVGIDLGTTYSCVATFSSKDGKTLILKNSMGKETTPSVIKIDNGNVLIGDDAKGEQKNGDLNTAAFYKSMMGDSSYSAFIDGKEYSAEDLSYLFLKSLKEDIEKANNVEIGSSVITVPAYFNEKQRNATLNAGNRAGLNVLKIINEPTSAIIAYGLNSGNDKNVLVYDLGGGTFDVTVAHVSGNKIDVLVTNGNHQLGGKDWDQVLLDTFKDAFYAEEGINVEDYPEELKELQIKCEDAKKRLSSVPSTTISMQVNGIMGKVDITKEEFDDKTSSLLNETFLLVDTCFKELSEQLNKPFSWNDIDEVVLVGGSTRMPQVKERVLSEYGKAPFTKDINVDTIVANGAALQAEICINNQITLTVTEKVNGVLQKKLCTISKSDISDITSHSLGMLANDASGKNFVNSIIIPKNSKINQKFVKEFSFAGKNLDVYILQGESREPTENDLLGKYIISKGTNSSSKIKVEYLYNQNGIVEVNGYDENGNKLEVKKEEVTDSISTVIEKIKNQKPSISRLEVIVSIDTSGSMDTGDAIGKSKAAFLDMLSSFNSSLTYICLSEFGEGERVVVPFTNEYSNIKSKISDLGTGGVGYGTSCHISDTCAHFTNKADAKVLIILTDGIWENEDKARRESTIAKDSHITIYAIGIGSANEKFLKDISSDGNGQKIDISNLSQAFQDVACSIASEIGGGRIS